MNKGDGKREKKKAKTYDGEGEKGQKDDKGVQGVGEGKKRRLEENRRRE